MPALPLAGLLIALAGAPFVLALAKARGLDPLSAGPRIACWLLAAGVIAIAARSDAAWPATLGLTPVTWRALELGLLTAVILLAGWPIVQQLQRMLGGRTVDRTEMFQRITRLPASYRAFLIVTAGVTEEVLYRGYGIGVGQHLLDGAWPAAALSLLLFVVAHYRWGASHLLSVLWAGGVLTVAFVLSNSLLACILAHTLVDAVGLWLAPTMMARRAARASAGPS